MTCPDWESRRPGSSSVPSGIFHGDDLHRDLFYRGLQIDQDLSELVKKKGKKTLFAATSTPYQGLDICVFAFLGALVFFFFFLSALTAARPFFFFHFSFVVTVKFVCVCACVRACVRAS